MTLYHGFPNERFFLGFEKILDSLISQMPENNYPPYTIEKLSEDKYLITMALAGFDKKDIHVELDRHSNSFKKLIISSKKKEEEETSKDVIYKGIALRKFKREFNLTDDIQVKGCKMENGLLSIELERVIPEEKKPLTFEVE